MTVIKASSLPMIERKNPQRAGRFFEKNIVSGEAGAPGNFLLNLAQTFKDFYSPRHRHNYDQIRLQIEGDLSFDTDGKMSPGVIAFFPEGTRYGPTTQSSEKSLTLVLQFEGASGSGYMSAGEREAAVIELKKSGEFRDGIYFPTPTLGRKNQDAYAACWEQHYKRPVPYPKELYQRPIFMNSTNFEWRPVMDKRGVYVKLLGVFERNLRIEYLRLEPGAAASVSGTSLHYMLKGKGKSGRDELIKDDVIYCREQETAEINGVDEMEICSIYMPTAMAVSSEPARLSA